MRRNCFTHARQVVATTIQIDGQHVVVKLARLPCLIAFGLLAAWAITRQIGEVIGQLLFGQRSVKDLGGPLAMGYLDSTYVAIDTPVWAIVRGKKVQMLVSKMPFVPQRYYRG